jgi:FAD/FMN-containing dehydrogenase
MNKGELICYETDSSGLTGEVKRVVFPKTVEEVKQIVEQTEVDIVPRGAGSGLVGGCVPNRSVVVDMSKLDKIISFNKNKKVVEVGAGITIKELNDRLSGKGLEFPIIPSNQGISTIGGMIATNAVGNRSMRYGTMRDWIEEITIVNGRGEIVKITKADVKEVCGMEGITGIIVSAILRVMPQIQRTASIFQSEDLEETLSIIRRLKLEKEVTSLEFYNPEISKSLGLPEKYHIIIGFDSNRGKIVGEEYRIISKFKHRAYSLLYSEGYTEILDPKFFFDKLKEFISFLESNKVPYFGYLGQGIVFPFFKKEDNEKREEVMKVISKINGKFSVYGTGIKRKGLIESFEKRVLQRVKLRYDPFCKFNKGKLVDIDLDERAAAHVRAGGPRHLKPFDVEEIEDLKKLEAAMNEDIPSDSKESIKEQIEEQIKEPVKALANENLDSLRAQAQINVEPTNIEPAKPDFMNMEIKKEDFEKPKTAYDEMQEFIKDVEKKETITSGEEKESINVELNEEINDYEETYNSEFSKDRMEKIENFAKNVAKDIHARKLDYELVKKPIQKEELLKKELKENKSGANYDSINQIMTNRVNKQPAPEQGGSVSMKDNLDSSNENKEQNNKQKQSVEDIMKKGFGFGSRKGDDK